VVTVVLKKSGRFSDVSREFNQLGYRPHPLKRNQNSAALKMKEEREMLIQIGIAGAAAGNIMIYAVSLYAGASGEFGELFHLLTVVFALPTLTYSAFPFYKNAWNALNNRTLSIDIPISLSLILGGVMGVYNLVMGIADNYFDSLTALVFLLLMSRYFLQKIQEKGLSASDLHFFYQSDSVEKLEEGRFRGIHPRFLKTGDVIRVGAGEFIPGDGVVVSGSSSLNNSLLTGESLPVNVGEGDTVFSGTQNLDQDLIIRMTKLLSESRLGSILKNVENGWAHRSQMVQLTNLVSKYFTFVVILLSVFLFFKISLTHDFRHALEGAITLMIVTCPCALALAVPLTFTRALSKASQQGIIIKSDEVIQKIAAIKNVFIDKTGTVTLGKIRITDFTINQPGAFSLYDVIASLEEKSQHPVGKALMDYVRPFQSQRLMVSDKHEVLGKGVSGTIGGHFYEIKENALFEDGKCLALFSLEDSIRSESKAQLAKIVERGINVCMISGDRREVVERIAKEAGLNSEQALSELSPEGKSRLVKTTPFSMMIGDGANDAVALSHADAGIAVMGAMDISLRAADVYLTTPGLESVYKLFILSQETMKVIKRNLVLSLCYNSVSVTLAFIGLIHPLAAAIIMPLSSLTVLFSTMIGTKELRYLWKS
jgi:Cu2+-exporting ATPase/Cu+-exporting ATPase